MYTLSCADGYKYPGTDGTYVLEIIPVAVGLAAIASDQSLCLFDPSRLSQGPLKRIQTDHGNLTNARTYSTTESIVCTTGENGTISLWDLRLAPANAQALRIGGMYLLVPPFCAMIC
jgi:WD repeat-containing protein 89